VAIKTIIFDLGRVIVPFDFNRGYSGMARHCPHPAARIPELIRPTGLVERFESGEIDSRSFVAELSRVLDSTAGYEEFCRIWSSVFLPETLVPDEFVAALKRNYRILLLSNTNAIHFEMIQENYPILRHFDDFILSYKVGAMKPSARIFEAAIERAATNKPEDCFFTDDIPAYIEGARRVGIDAAVFHDYGQLCADLAARGVMWDLPAPEPQPPAAPQL
jgi:glucose-1-phosphatase